MSMRFTPRASSDADASRTFGPLAGSPREHIDALEAALEAIRAAPTQGSLYESETFGTPVRRVLVPAIRAHVYYVVEGDDIVVLSVWGLP
jgi:plasmid stabilization system protein ParE